MRYFWIAVFSFFAAVFMTTALFESRRGNSYKAIALAGIGWANIAAVWLNL